MMKTQHSPVARRRPQRNSNSTYCIKQEPEYSSNVPPEYLAASFQHSRAGASAATATHASMTNRVNGIGMWKAWTRSFDTPMLALLDLFDNAVDASWISNHMVSTAGGMGMMHPKIHIDIDKFGQNGVVLRNSCSRTIVPLEQVLEVYKSSKIYQKEEIGENGIGVKHACASLSSLSLIFVKRQNRYYSMGILMKELQREEGIVLPSCEWDCHDETLQECLENIVKLDPDRWGRAIKEYGEGDLEVGISNCICHFDEMRKGHEWKDYRDVFTVVLTKLHHQSFGKSTTINEVIVIDSDDEETNKKGRARESTKRRSRRKVHPRIVDEDEMRSRSDDLLSELVKNLPSLYLHLHDIEIKVKQQKIDSIYWEKRLVELTKFEIAIHQSVPWQSEDPSQWQTQRKATETVRFFLGFNPSRCSDKASKEELTKDKQENMRPNQGKSETNPEVQSYETHELSSALRVYTYSRQSGRLIKIQHDPRSEYGLIAGSTDFKQGLTVIIDDYNGTLPLNPTKQDTAFGHSSHGQTHASNIKAWTAALIHHYWTYHYKRFGESKLALTASVSKTTGVVKKAFKAASTPRLSEPIPLRAGDFLSFPGLEFKQQNKNGIAKIRVSAKKQWKVRVPEASVPDPNGRVSVQMDELIRLDEEAARKVYTAANVKKAKKSTSTSKAAGSKRARGERSEGASRSAADWERMENDLTAVTEELYKSQAMGEKQAAKIERLRGIKAHFQDENARLEEALEAAKGEVEHLRKKVARAKTNGTSGVSSSNESSVTIAKLQNEVQKYKKRADFYSKQSRTSENRVKDIEREKRELLQRIEELEEEELENSF